MAVFPVRYDFLEDSDLCINAFETVLTPIQLNIVRKSFNSYPQQNISHILLVFFRFV